MSTKERPLNTFWGDAVNKNKQQMDYNANAREQALDKNSAANVELRTMLAVASGSSRKRFYKQPKARRLPSFKEETFTDSMQRDTVQTRRQKRGLKRLMKLQKLLLNDPRKGLAEIDFAALGNMLNYSIEADSQFGLCAPKVEDMVGTTMTDIKKKCQQAKNEFEHEKLLLLAYKPLAKGTIQSNEDLLRAATAWLHKSRFASPGAAVAASFAQRYTAAHSAALFAVATKLRLHDMMEDAHLRQVLLGAEREIIEDDLHTMLGMGGASAQGVTAEKPRVNLGTFREGAKHAVISTPGGVPRSASTRVKVVGCEVPFTVALGEVVMGNLVLEEWQYQYDDRRLGKSDMEGGISPILKAGKKYTVQLDGGAEVVVDGEDLEYTGRKAYEYWAGLIGVHQAHEKNRKERLKVNLSFDLGMNIWRALKPKVLKGLRDGDVYRVAYSGNEASSFELSGKVLKDHCRYAFSCVWTPGKEGCCTRNEAGEKTKDAGAAWVHNGLKDGYNANMKWPSRKVVIKRCSQEDYKDHAGKIAMLPRAMNVKDPFEKEGTYNITIPAGSTSKDDAYGKFTNKEELEVAVLGEYLELIPHPPCGHCAWFTPWKEMVLNCHADGQTLKFSYLEFPMQEDQPTFYCAATGERYWVGYAQSVELEWAQNRMGLAVEPIVPSDIVASVFTEHVREKALQLSTLLKQDPVGGITKLGLQKDDFSCYFAYESPGARELAVIGREVELLLLDVEVAWVAAILEQQRRLLRETKLRREFIRVEVRTSIKQAVDISKEDGSEDGIIGEIDTAINAALARAQKMDWGWKLQWAQHSKGRAKMRLKKDLWRKRRDKVLYEAGLKEKEDEKERWKNQRRDARKVEQERKKLAGKSWDDPGKWKSVPMWPPEETSVQSKKGSENAPSRSATPNPLSPSHS
jgi:hypothetical protein